MRKSVIKEKLARNEPVLFVTLHLADQTGYELASLMGFDGIWIDLEHHSHSDETAQSLMRAARVGKSDIIARPAKGEFMRLARLLESGAQGILYPRIDNADEARDLVNAAKFPPVGKRGIDGGNPDMPYCTMPLDEYVVEANVNTFVIAQIEDEESLDNVEAIMAVDGIDGIFMGPADFSSLGGYPGDLDHPRVQAAMEKIATAARNTGKHWGRPAASADEAATFIEMGAKLIGHSSDLLILKTGLEEIQTKFEALGFNFQNHIQSGQGVTSVYKA